MNPTQRDKLRKKFARTVGWLKYVDPAQKCDGIKWGTVSLKDLFEHGPHRDPLPPRGIQEKSRCRTPAHWVYKALPRYTRDVWVWPAQSGSYCWSHLFATVESAPRDYKRWCAASAKMRVEEEKNDA